MGEYADDAIDRDLNLEIDYYNPDPIILTKKPKKVSKEAQIAAGKVKAVLANEGKT